MQICDDPHVAARSPPNKECPKGFNLDVSSQKPELSSDFLKTNLSAGTKPPAWSHLDSFLKKSDDSSGF